MGGGGSVVNKVANFAVDPIGSAASAFTGDKIKTTIPAVGYNELVKKPRDAKNAILDDIRGQEEAAKKAEQEYQREQSEEKKRQRDLALQNLQRSQARLKSRPRSAQGYGGTILTSPLGVAGGNDGQQTQRTLLGS